MRRRSPTLEEMRLWAEVARSVAPLGDREPIEAPEATDAPTPRPRPAESSYPALAPIRSRRSAQAALQPIDRRTVSRVARGTLDIDARIDLHGMTQQTAHGRLARFLRQAQADGARMALVITGKGRTEAEPGSEGERGVLRRAVPLWLSGAEMRPYVVGFGEASAAHGGAGALYVRLRRARG